MIAFIAFSALLAVASAQYQYQGQQQGYSQPQQAPQAYNQQPHAYQAQPHAFQAQPHAYQAQPHAYQAQPHAYQPQPHAYQAQPQSYQHQPQPQAHQPQPQQQKVYQAAPVFYVDYGKELVGDYKFGYHTGKGNDANSFREETRLADGTVQGSYGYVDASGQQKIIKYTAGKNGYQVQGDGIPKAPAAPVHAAPTQPQQPAYNQGGSPQNYNNGGYQ